MSSHLERVVGALNADGIDLLLLTDPADIAYVSGFSFEPFEHIAAFTISREGESRFLLPGYEEAGLVGAVPADTKLMTFPEVGSDADAFAAFVEGLDKHAKIGLSKATMSLSDYERFAAALGRDTFVDASDLVPEARSVKDEEEIALIREASEVGDRVVQGIIDKHLVPGAIEAELGGEMGRMLRMEGADGSAFEPGITSGWRSALPHGPEHSRESGARSGADAIAEGDLLVFDFSISVGGYIADLSRTYVLGKSEPRQREIFEVVKEAQDVAIDACRPGVTAGEVDRRSKAVIEKAGFGDNSPQKTGHGVGLELHELPFVGSSSEQELQPGMTFCIEPAIYIDGYGGARVEDVVVVTDGAPEVLSDRSNQDSLELDV